MRRRKLVVTSFICVAGCGKTLRVANSEPSKGMTEASMRELTSTREIFVITSSTRIHARVWDCQGLF